MAIALEKPENADVLGMVPRTNGPSMLLRLVLSIAFVAAFARPEVVRAGEILRDVANALAALN